MRDPAYRSEAHVTYSYGNLIKELIEAPRAKRRPPRRLQQAKSGLPGQARCFMSKFHQVRTMEVNSMRFVTLVSAVVVCLSTAAYAQAWSEYINREEFFTVNFPGNPAVKEIPYKTEKGTALKAKVFTANAPAGSITAGALRDDGRRLQLRAGRARDRGRRSLEGLSRERQRDI